MKRENDPRETTTFKGATMSRKQEMKYPFVMTALFLAMFASSSVLWAGSVTVGKPGVGDAAPLFSTDDIDGTRTVLDEALKSGKVVLLNFWGLRCSACIEEIGYLNPMYEKYKGKGVLFLGVNVDGVSSDVLKKSIPALSNIPRFPVLPDPDFKISDLYNMLATPLSFVIGRDGKIVYRHDDFKPGDEKELEAVVNSLLEEK